MTLNLYNTLSGQVEPFAPADGKEVHMYACGLTVYSRGHIGNYRTFVAVDLLRRALQYKGWRVQHVMNITDVDDRIIRQAGEAGQDLGSFVAPHIASFKEDMATLRLEEPHLVPRATEHIPEMVSLIERLLERKHAAQAEDGVYFRIASFPAYGRLSRLDVAGIKDGARVDTDKYDKENARDFALWKSKGDEPEWAQWDAPFGRGRPGWHIECSAMGMKYLGETFDLHCGGEDLIFPHHENEIAQSEGGTGKPFVRHWFHVKHLMIEEAVMSKSKGNFFTVADVLAEGHRPDAVRYLLTSGHYRRQLNFTWESLRQAAAALERIHGCVQRLEEAEGEGPAAAAVGAAVAKARDTFDAALDDDLNTPEAWAAVHGLVGEANALVAEGVMTRAGAAAVLDQLRAFDTVFAVLFPAGAETLSPDEQSLFDQRQQARAKREFKLADDLRRRLEDLGVVLEDSSKGTRWRRKR
jgi:cysteinyl-tRNA synthetase